MLYVTPAITRILEQQQNSRNFTQGIDPSFESNSLSCTDQSRTTGKQCHVYFVSQVDPVQLTQIQIFSFPQLENYHVHVTLPAPVTVFAVLLFTIQYSRN